MTSLIQYNTFGIDAKAIAIEHFTSADDVATLLTKHSKQRILIVGSGSNILFTNDFNGIILVSDNKSITSCTDGNSILVRCGAGVLWDDFVKHCVEHNWQGAENLSLIPGTCGASAVQNIGAYGVEAKDLIESVEAVERTTLKTVTLNANDLQYGYRTSRFKTDWADKYVIISVTYRLNVNGTINLSYRGLIEMFDEQKRLHPTENDLTLVREAIIRVRQSKLPDVKAIGSAGSFFMNPAVARHKADELISLYPDMPHFDNADGSVKIPAAWLIEHTGWKGYRNGDAGVYEKQPLVLVNYGKATGKDITELAQKIQDSVKDKFGIELKTEVIYV